MASYRHKRFERSKEPPVEFRIQPRDREILRDVSDYRFLSTEQILALYPTSGRNVRQRLQNLYHAGFLERPAAQKAFPNLSNHSLVYSLGEKGAAFLERRDFTKNKKFGSPYLAHALMVSEFRATLTLALRKYPNRPKVERWVQGYDLKDALASRGERPELVPDAFFTVRAERGALDFFLEADRSTMTQKLMLAKMRTYWKWQREKRFQKTLGIENFRVLTITPSDERAENLCRVTKQADDRKTGSNMFLFLSEKQYSLKKPEAVLSPIWASPRGEKHALLE
jgi:hypothetical protein